MSHHPKNMFGMTIGKSSFSLADQVVVSGANFLTTILIGRFGGPEELAIYVLGFSIVILITSVLQTLVTVPYSIFAHRIKQLELAEYRGAVLVQYGLLSGIAVLALGIWSWVISMGLQPPGLEPVLHVLAVVIPFCLLREFARQFAFTHLNSEKALRLDCYIVALQVIGLTLLAIGGVLSAVTANLVIGIASATVTLSWLRLSRSKFEIRKTNIVPSIKKNWSQGKWMLINRMISHLNSSIFVLWLLTFILGTNAVGIFAACATIVSFSNPLILGVGQMLTPWIARVYNEGGIGQSYKMARNAALGMGLVLSVFCLVIFFFGDAILGLTFGPEYGSHRYTLTLLAVSALVSAIDMPAASGLWALEQGGINVRAGLAGFAATVVSAAMFVSSLGILGVVCALLVGGIVATTVTWISFSRLVHSKTPPLH